VEGRTERREAVDPRAGDSIQRALDLAEARLGQDIGLAEMSAAACYSPFYFSRIFSHATGHAPYDYLMRRRVARAAEAVVDGDDALIDIALRFGFASPDTFARAFRRCFGMAPSEARRAGTYPGAVARSAISRDFVEEALRTPFGPPAKEWAEEVVLADPGGRAPAGLDGSFFEIAQRDSALAPQWLFVGALAARGMETVYPGRETRLPAGVRARFRVGASASRLAHVVEYAYRSWLPLSGRVSLPPFDVAAWLEGVPVYFELHLAE
jgi:AraC-like DNA-binding protein